MCVAAKLFLENNTNLLREIYMLLFIIFFLQNKKNMNKREFGQNINVIKYLMG